MPGSNTGSGKSSTSSAKKKNGDTATQQTLTSLSSSLSSRLRSASSRGLTTQQVAVQTFSEEAPQEAFVASLDSALDIINAELQKIRDEFSQVVKDHFSAIEAIKAENVELKRKSGELEARITLLEKSLESHEMLINKQERFSRRNNIRIVGLKSGKDEDCMKLATEVIGKIGIANCKLERAHRDGRSVPGRERHLLIKLSYYQDKVGIMKNARRMLESENYYVVDDLTKLDLKEKRRWAKEVNELFQQGTRLRFFSGCWRMSNGKPFQFASH